MCPTSGPLRTGVPAGSCVEDFPFGVLVSVPSVTSDTSGWVLWECIVIELPGAKVIRRMRSTCPGQFAPASTVAWAEEAMRENGGRPALRLKLSLCGYLGRYEEARACLSRVSLIASQRSPGSCVHCQRVWSRNSLPASRRNCARPAFRRDDAGFARPSMTDRGCPVYGSKLYRTRAAAYGGKRTFAKGTVNGRLVNGLRRPAP